MPSKIRSTVFLPKCLADEFNKITLTKSERDHALKFLDRLIYKSYKDTGLIDSYVDMSAKYFRTTFTTDYLPWLKKLINNKIINKSKYYSYINDIHKCYSYSININTSSPLLLLLLETSDYVPMNYNSKKQVNTEVEIKTKKMVSEDLKKLKIDWGKLKKLASHLIEKVDIKMFKVNDEIERHSMEVITFDLRGKEKSKVWMSKSYAIKVATSNNELLIEDNGRYYITDETCYILRKKLSMHISYKGSIEKMERGIYYANRNDRNNRLDTNITNMATLLTDEICNDNDLVQLDLCNAQFAILSKELEQILETEDFREFKNHSYEGTLYKYIQEKLELKSEKEAKTSMFELMFSKEDLRSARKNKLKTIFPSVVDIVDKYKKEHGYAEFSVMLQQKESEIFIDGLWTRLKQQGKFCLTKHDSLLVRRKDEQYVREFVKEYFKKIDFKGKIKE